MAVETVAGGARPLLLETTGIAKTFPGVVALDGVSFDLRAGEVHALVGENGAGKSTYIKILGGVYHADEGTILLSGQPTTFKSTSDSQRRGIAIIFQEFNLMSELSVAENVYVGREPRTRAGFIDWKRMRAQTQRILEQLDIEIDPRELVKNLAVAEKQMVEIAKALSLDARIIIMDEPTAALNDREVRKLFEIIQSLKRQGRGVIYISHRLEEIFRIADRVTVFRDGQHVGTMAVADTSEQQIVQMMVGHVLGNLFTKDHLARGEVALAVEHLSVEGAVHDVSFSVRRGEIIGISGVIGSGRSELVQAIFGLAPYSRGRVLLEGREIRITSPRDAIELGIGYVPDDRATDGILPDMSVRENLTVIVVRFFKRWGGVLIDRRREHAAFDELARGLRIKYAHPNRRIIFLSGGNQQKVILARSLANRAKVLILCEPTRGVDVGAKAEIHRLMNDLARQGVAIVMLSSELPELINMSDRILVMHDGAVTGRLEGATISEANVVACATGQASIGVDAATVR